MVGDLAYNSQAIGFFLFGSMNGTYNLPSFDRSDSPAYMVNLRDIASSLRHEYCLEWVDALETVYSGFTSTIDSVGDLRSQHRVLDSELTTSLEQRTRQIDRAGLSRFILPAMKITEVVAPASVYGDLSFRAKTLLQSQLDSTLEVEEDIHLFNKILFGVIKPYLSWFPVRKQLGRENSKMLDMYFDTYLDRRLPRLSSRAEVISRLLESNFASYEAYTNDVLRQVKVDVLEKEKNIGFIQGSNAA